jgi:hypothetical protein
MNELHITERIDEILSILNSGNFRGYEQWNVIVAAMQKLAAISHDITKQETDEKVQEENGGD